MCFGSSNFFFVFNQWRKMGLGGTQIYSNAVLHSCEIVTCSSVRFGGTVLRCSGINKVSELMKTLTLTSPDLLISFKSLWSLYQDCLHTFTECIEWIKPSIKNQHSMAKIKLSPPPLAPVLSNASLGSGRSDSLTRVQLPAQGVQFPFTLQLGIIEYLLCLINA